MDSGSVVVESGCNNFIERLGKKIKVRTEVSR